jgi:hypothetical protein
MIPEETFPEFGVPPLVGGRGDDMSTESVRRRRGRCSCRRLLRECEQRGGVLPELRYAVGDEVTVRRGEQVDPYEWRRYDSSRGALCYGSLDSQGTYVND